MQTTLRQLYTKVFFNNLCEDWGLFHEKFVRVTTDNVGNSVKAIEMSFGRAEHVRCLSHTLNLVVKNSLNTSDIKFFRNNVGKIVTWFHQGGVGAEELR